MASCRDCRYYKTDVDLPYPVCTYNEFHFEGDFTPCESFSPKTSSSSSSSSSSSGGGFGCLGPIIAVIVIAVIAFFVIIGDDSGSSSDNYGSSIQSASQTYIATAQVSTSAGLRLREGPSTSSNKILTMPYLSEVKVIERENGWAYVDYNGTFGWCSEDYLDFQ